MYYTVYYTDCFLLFDGARIPYQQRTTRQLMKEQQRTTRQLMKELKAEFVRPLDYHHFVCVGYVPTAWIFEWQWRKK